MTSLPIDPTNTYSNGLYYSYVTNSSSNQYLLTALPEGQRQKASLSTSYNIPNYPGVIASGSDMSISPIYSNSGLVGYWPMDEGSGTVTADKSGNGNNGTLINSPVWTDGKIGKALSFDGSGSYVNINISLGTSASFAIWATRNTTQNSMLFALGPGSPGPDLYFSCNAIMWNIYDGCNNQFGTIPNNANDGRYHSYIVVISSGSTKLYYDGELLGNAVYRDPTYTSLQIGGQASYIWGGKIDDFRVYNRALSVAEVVSLYNSAK